MSQFKYHLLRKGFSEFSLKLPLPIYLSLITVVISYIKLITTCIILLVCSVFVYVHYNVSHIRMYVCSMRAGICCLNFTQPQKRKKKSQNLKSGVQSKLFMWKVIQGSTKKGLGGLRHREMREANYAIY